MTTDDLHLAEEPSGFGSGVRAVATVMMSDHVEVTVDLLCCDAGDLHTVTMASPDGDTQLVLAGTRQDLTRAMQAALAALAS